MTPSGKISVAEPAPVARYWAPKLSRDGQALVWIDKKREGARFSFWQSYREKGRYLVSWTIDGQSGRHEVPLGRAITDIAVSSGGVYIAISTSSGLNIGSVPDTVYVLHSADGADVFRRTLPRYARLQLAILGPRYLAYSRYDGTGQWIEVVELPE